MTLSLRSPAGYGPSSALFQSQQLTDFPTNFALSFWIGGQFEAAQPLFQTNLQAMSGSQIGVVGGTNWNASPLFWFGDPACNYNTFNFIEPVNRTVPTPNFMWTVATRVFAANNTQLDFFVPTTNYSNQGLRYNDFPSDIGYTNSVGNFGRDLTGAYRWNTGRLNHIFITFQRFQFWYDWAIRTNVVINGAFTRSYFNYVTPIKPLNTYRLCIGSPAIPMNADDELVVDDFRVYELALDVPPYDNNAGGNWDFRNALATWEMAQEIGYNRGRDRINSAIYAQVPFLNLTPGAAYPNGGTFQDATKRLTFTAVTSGALLSQAPVNPPSSRPVLGRAGRYRSPSNVQHIPVAFQGRTDSFNEEYAFEGCFVDSADTRLWNPVQAGAFPAALNHPESTVPAESKLRRADNTSTFAGAKIISV